MSNISWKNLYECFPKFNCSPINIQPPPSHSSSNQDHNTLVNAPTSPLIKNFNSLYTLTSSDDFFSWSSSSDSDHHHPPSANDSHANFATAFASQRFFCSSPGPSNSILHSPPPSSSSPLLSGAAAAVPTYSTNTYADFRRSMQEMVEARGLTDVKGEWDFLHELLSCYLRLNPDCTHRIIFTAFSDLIVSLVAYDSCRKIEEGHRCAASRQLV